MLSDYFSGTTETVCVIPKKNGKTTLLAALALYHLKHVPNADVLMVASSRDQAKRMYEQAAELVRFSYLRDEFEVKTGYNYIWPAGGDSAGSKIAVKPAEAGTVDGVEPTLALVDELHRHRNLRLYTVIRRGLIQGRMVTISTAGAGHENPLWEIRERVYREMQVRRKSAYRYASSDGFAWHEWALEDDADLSNMRLVKRANPLPSHTIETLGLEYASPSTVPEEWARLACGVWTFGARPWITAPEWDRLAVDIGGVEEGEEVVAHVSHGRDGAAIALAAMRDEGVAVRAEVLTGDVRFEDVENRLIELAGIYGIRECSCDEDEFERPAQLLEQRGLPMIFVPHSTERLSKASSTLHRLIQSKLLRHDGDPALRGSVLAGTSKQTQRGWHLVMAPTTRALITLAFAVYQATEVPPETPRYEAL